MKELRQIIKNFILKPIVYTGLALLPFTGCVEGPKQERQKPEPQYISGIVKSETYVKYLTRGDRYYFSANVNGVLKDFRCIGDISAQTLDALLDSEDKFTMKLESYQDPNDEMFYVSKNDFIEINGVPIAQRESYW